MKHRQLIESFGAVLLCATMLLGCNGASSEAERVQIPVQVQTLESTEVTNDLGWTVEIETLRASVADVTFTTDGEEHVESNAFLELLVPDAHAHPGHQAGGEVIGSLPGRHVVAWTDDATELGDAEFIVGDYTGANFRYTRASSEDGLDADDRLLGHSVLVEGVARRDGQEVSFEARIDQDEDRSVIGLPFDASIDTKTEGIVTLDAHPADPAEGDTLFDGIDFGEVADGASSVTFEPGTESYNRLRRALQVHDHFSASLRN